MAYEGITVSQLEALPEVDRSPQDTLFVALGCVACPNQVCFKVDGLDSMHPYPQSNAADSLDAATCNLDRGTVIDPQGKVGWSDPCDSPCDETEEIKKAVTSINRRFGRSLEFKQGGK